VTAHSGAVHSRAGILWREVRSGPRIILDPGQKPPPTPSGRGFSLRRAGARIASFRMFEMSNHFPKFKLQVCQLPNGEWVIACPSKPLTEEEAEQVVIAYAALVELEQENSVAPHKPKL
jgi:hypothetical protein